MVSSSCSAAEIAATDLRPRTAAQRVSMSAAVVIGHIEKYVFRSIDKKTQADMRKFGDNSKLRLLYAVVRVDEVLYQNNTMPQILADTIIPVDAPLGDMKSRLIGVKKIFILDAFEKYYVRLDMPERYMSRVLPMDISQRDEIELAIEKVNVRNNKKLNGKSE